MALVACPECGRGVSERAASCPNCGHPLREEPAAPPQTWTARRPWGFEWKSKARIGGWPLVHVAVGRDAETGRLRVAKGIVAIGQFAIGVVTIAQFGIGVLFGFGQFVGGLTAVGQFAAGYYFALGQFAAGLTAIGQLAAGKYVLAQLGFGRHVWTTQAQDPAAVEHFTRLWEFVRGFFG